ncbi:RFX DNA-binding domain-containing protein [Colletotrichum tamarilloi]|uniref:RFX DNA-binding domain-containing protein n=1 Tax=Colletotrichum tamarilloi TaxID=1209934 RepID=A0ABQ9RIA9_9PEZI|nr:RFX DNA-binding domain-containing protein [Colletotrichum tamarilloi]KAK1504006.1 RFX DNA-binding domain-containing protein [Colletotrichum tamarilloi]
MEHDHLSQALRAKKRPQSRASTASVHSISTQPTMEQQQFADAPELYSAQWVNNDQRQQRSLAPASRITPEEMMLHAAATQMQNAREYSMPPGMSASMSQSSAHMGHSMSFQQHPMQRHPLPSESFANNSFTDDSQMIDRDEDGDSLVGAMGMQKSSSARSSANNELEMRHLFNANKHRGLQDVAGELHGNERGPNSERTRQVFAMLWINSVCTKGKGSVPRGRVYANYASRCATERITVLNPASFGKLVRVLFPGLKTRRLGVRGESKYHYVNFCLVDDQPDLREPEPHIPLAISEPPRSQSFSAAPVKAQPAAAVLPSPDAAKRPESPAQATHHTSRSHSFYSHPNVTSADHLNSSASKTSLQFSFPSEADELLLQSNEPLALPRMEPFLPSGTDPDAAKSLSALYRSHCTSLVECVRYCKEKTFFHLYTSFQGTLTMPVQKLLGHPSLAPWIEECDFILYQRMLRIISGLTLQVVPKPVLDTLRGISERLVPHIREAFQGQPHHVIRAKEAPATIFAALLDRALRVNLTAHAAANMLSNPANRDQMYLDWITMVRVRKVAECVPTRGMDDLVNLLVTELRDLLSPMNVPWEVECLTVYGDIALRNGRQPGVESAGDPNGQNVLERWVGFLKSLPIRFPYASHTEIVYAVQRVGTAVMRDLTMAQGKSFGSWWVTKCWIDEMTCFLAEQGGFLQMKTSGASAAVANPQSAAQESNRQGSRFSAGSEDFNFSSLPQAQPDKAPFPPSTSQGQVDSADMSAGNNPDDSGIGIRTPEEDFPMDKYTFSHSEVNQALLANAELQQ